MRKFPAGAKPNRAQSWLLLRRRAQFSRFSSLASLSVTAPQEHAQEPQPLFSSDCLLHLQIVFRMKRPNSHYVANKPGAGRLKASFQNEPHKSKVDIDNLLKFVMDSLNGLAWTDDSQVSACSALKIYDNSPLGQGGIDFQVHRISPEELQSRAFHINGKVEYGD